MLQDPCSKCAVRRTVAALFFLSYHPRFSIGFQHSPFRPHGRELSPGFAGRGFRLSARCTAENVSLACSTFATKMAVSFVSSFHRCPSVSCQRGVNHVHQLRPISTGHVRQFSVDKRNRTGRSASQCELVIRARSSQARQAPTQSVTKFSKQDAESVRKSLQTLTEVRTLL